MPASFGRMLFELESIENPSRFFQTASRFSEQDRPDVARLRALWKKIQSRLDLKRLVFIEETWAKTNMTRTHDWSRGGAHRQGAAWHWKTMTFLAALRCDEITAPFVLDGPINAESFLRIWQVRAPTLKQGDIVVLS